MPTAGRAIETPIGDTTEPFRNTDTRSDGDRIISGNRTVAAAFQNVRIQTAHPIIEATVDSDASNSDVRSPLHACNSHVFHF